MRGITAFFILGIVWAKISFALPNHGNCRLRLVEAGARLAVAHGHLRERLAQDDHIRRQPQSPFRLAEPPPVILKRGELLPRVFAELDRRSKDPSSAKSIVQVPMAMQPLARALNERLFVVQDYVLYRTDKYKAILAASHGIEPVELETSLKQWIDYRLEKAMALITRSSIMNAKQMEEAEAELTAVVSDLETLQRNTKFRVELVERFRQVVARERMLVGLGQVERIVGRTASGEIVPDEPGNPWSLQDLVPQNWRPWWVSDLSENTPPRDTVVVKPSRGGSLWEIINAPSKPAATGVADLVGDVDPSNPMNAGPGRILGDGEEFEPLNPTGPSFLDIQNQGPGRVYEITDP